MNENLDIEVCIKEAERSLDEQFGSVTTIREVAKTIFTATSLIIAFSGIVQIFNNQVPAEYFSLYVTLVLITLVCYPLLIYLCLKALSLAKMFGPTKTDIETYQEAFIGKEERDILKQQLSNALNAYKLNQTIISQRENLIIWASTIFVLIVILLVAIGLLPRVTVP